MRKKLISGKALSLSLGLFCCSLLSFGQLQITPEKHPIGTIRSFGFTYFQLSYTVDRSDTTYSLMFKNLQYEDREDYQTITFHGEGNALNNFYDLMTSVWRKENRRNKDYEVNFRLGNQNVSVSNFRLTGISYVRLATDSGYCILTRGQVDQLFGKRE